MFFGEEIVEFDVPMIFRSSADPLAVADDQVAQFAVRIELVEEAVGIARPWDELVFHFDTGLLGKVLAKLNQCVRRIPGRPAQGKLLALGRDRLAGKGRQRHSGEKRQRAARPPWP